LESRFGDFVRRFIVGAMITTQYGQAPEGTSEHLLSVPGCPAIALVDAMMSVKQQKREAPALK
jgi:hypothetical protein